MKSGQNLISFLSVIGARLRGMRLIEETAYVLAIAFFALSGLVILAIPFPALGERAVIASVLSFDRCDIDCGSDQIREIASAVGSREVSRFQGWIQR